MKLLHTSDWHLGKSVMGCSMLNDQEHFIKNVFLSAVDDKKPDAVIIAGDIFDRQVASVEAVELFNLTVTELCMKRKIKTFVIAGNHDGAERLSVYKELLEKEGLFISAKPLDTPPVRVECDDGEMYIHLLPYFDAALVRDVLSRTDIRGQNAAMKAVLGEMKPIAGAKNILVSHCFAAGGKTCDSESALSVGASDEIDPSLFDGFDYVALGHLHGPQKVRTNGRYSGSPLKYSFDEEHQKKSLSFINFADGEAEIETMPIRPLKNMRTVSGTVEEIIEKGKTDAANKDYIYANLLDERPVFEPMQKLREVYPNILGLKPGWLDFSGNGENSRLKANLRRGSGDRTLFEEFMRQVCLCEPKEDELAVFDDMMKKAGGKE
jgi:exonuclease SbcD